MEREAQERSEVIPIRNIYYMLSYAFGVLNEAGFRDVETESFENVADLYAAILARGVAMQVKRGLGREYVEQIDSLRVLRGRIDMSESVRTRSLQRQQMVCTFDEFSVDSYMNRILKTTMELLLRADIDRKRKQDLIKVLVYFRDVSTLDIHSIRWNLQYNRNNRTYQMLIAICYMVIHGLLQTRIDGTTRLMDFLDDPLKFHLYEKFILEYYRQEFPQLHASAAQIDWAVDDGMLDLLPNMQSDITLRYKGQVLIIDAKFYQHTMQALYGTHKQHSDNMYQIFTYVKNMEAGLKDDSTHTGYGTEIPASAVSGMLLYARTDEEIQPDKTYQMSGNEISVRTLDLNCSWPLIKGQLDGIVESRFGIVSQ